MRKHTLVSLFLSISLIFTSSTAIYAADIEISTDISKVDSESYILNENNNEQSNDASSGISDIQTTGSSYKEVLDTDDDTLIDSEDEDEIDVYSIDNMLSSDDAFLDPSTNEDSASLESSELIEKYITPKLPPLRDQGEYNTSWAHTATALAEIYEIQYQGADPNIINFSELHLAYFAFNSMLDPLGGLAGDKNEVLNDINGASRSFLDVDCDLEFASNVLATGCGLAPENAAPYSYAEEALSEGLPEEIAYTRNRYVTHSFSIPISAELYDIEKVKEIIYGFGAIGIKINYDNSYYCESYNSFYCDEKIEADQYVTIVGWDDTFSKDNYNIPAPGNGAWLVRNSHSTGSYEDNQNFAGYFYISYYDNSIYEQATSLMTYSNDYEYMSTYDIYQYDGAAYSDTLENCTIASNVFISKGNEKLKGISFYTPDRYVNYNVAIYFCDSQSNVNPMLNASKVYNTTIQSDFPGMITCEFYGSVTLPENQIFAVVISSTDKDKKLNFGIEKSYQSGCIKSTSHASDFQSLAQIDGNWIDIGHEYNANLRIKAYTQSNDFTPPSSSDINYDLIPLGEKKDPDPIEVENPDLSSDYEDSSEDNELEFNSIPISNDYVKIKKYVTPNLPSLRNQGSYGTCWAHSALAVAEISLIKQNLSTEDINLSELHLAYFTYNTALDPLGGLSGDSNKMIPSYGRSNFMDSGGQRIFASNVLATWSGAASESTAPYSNAEAAIKNGLDNKIAYNDQAHLSDYYEVNINSNPTNIQAVKKLIYNYGSVGASLYWYSGFYNSRYNSYYCSYPSTNHAVLFVGWDDTFDKNNFNRPAPGNGAWIIRNSWTTGSYEDNQSRYGYFYISYYDTSIKTYGNAYVFSKSTDYDNNYQYDGAMKTAEVSNAKSAANIFNSKNHEKLKAAAFYTSSADVDYTINIYTFDDATNITSPDLGTLSSTVSGKTSYAGQYTIPLTDEVDLPAGTTFSVVVNLSKSGGSATYGAESNSESSWYKCTASASAGQSFIKYNDNWSDYGFTWKRNLRIKAFTKNVDSPDDPDEPILESLSITGPSTVTKGQAAQYTAIPTPKDYKLKSLVWTSSDTSILSIDSNGFANALSQGTVTITATCEGISATLNVVCVEDVQTSYIIFDANGGTGTMKKISYVPDTDISLPANAFTRTGYRFSGWNTAADGTGTAYTNKETVRIILEDSQVNITLYAQWAGNKYFIYYSGNGGKGSMAATNAVYGTNIKLSQNRFSNGKKKFAGWNTAKDGTGIRYANGATLKNLTHVYNGTITLYAQWTKDEIKINFLEIYSSKDSVAKGKTLKFHALINGIDSKKSKYGKYLIWTISDGFGTGSATIDPDTGVLTAKEEGTVKVKVTSSVDSSVYELSQIIHIYIPVKKASINKKSVTMSPGTSFQLYVSMTAKSPDESDSPTLDKDVYWHLKNTEDSQYVSVDSAGLLSAKSKTKKPVLVQATYTPYGGKKKNLTCKVTVKDTALKALSFDHKALTIREGESEVLYAITSPETTSVSGVKWEIVSGAKYISLSPIDDYGTNVLASSFIPENKVTAKIRATTNATTSSKKALSKTITVTITAKAASISLKSTPSSIKLKKSVTLTPIVYTSKSGVKAVNQKVTYTSSNEAILSVSSNGKITGKRKGVAQITITSKDNPDVSRTISISVE